MEAQRRSAGGSTAPRRFPGPSRAWEALTTRQISCATLFCPDPRVMPVRRLPITPQAPADNHSKHGLVVPLPSFHLHSKGRDGRSPSQGLPQMQIRFADSRPTGDYALVLPVAGKDRSTLGRLGLAQQTVSSALDRSRFEGDASSASEQFIDDNGTVRRLLVVGTGVGVVPGEAAEKLGG